MSSSIYHYTYIITNTTNQMKYIGVRSCSCLPENDSDYMGSSKSLDEAMNETPEAFTKIIIDTFPTREIANANEQWLHEHYDVARNPEFYNLCIAPLGFCRAGSPISAETRKKLSEASKGRTLTPEHKKKLSAANKGQTRSPAARKNISAAKKGKNKGKNNPNYGNTHSPETKLKMSAAQRGKTLSPEHKKKISESSKGKTLTPEHKKKISGPRGPREKITCPHCSKIGGGSAMKRWHFSNCREIS